MPSILLWGSTCPQEVCCLLFPKSWKFPCWNPPPLPLCSPFLSLPQMVLRLPHSLLPSLLVWGLLSLYLLSSREYRAALNNRQAVPLKRKYKFTVNKKHQGFPRSGNILHLTSNTMHKPKINVRSTLCFCRNQSCKSLKSFIWSMCIKVFNKYDAKKKNWMWQSNT